MKYLLSLNIAFLFGALPIFAMDQLAKEELSEVHNRIRQIEFAEEMGSAYFMGSGQTKGAFIIAQLCIIEQIFNKKNIAHPAVKTYKWLKDVKDEVNNALDRLTLASSTTMVAQTSRNICEDQDECDITGLDKADVLLALWNGAFGNGGFWPSTHSLTREIASQVLQENQYIDYLGGKALKVNLNGNTFSANLYNRDNGAGRAQKIVTELRKSLNS